MSIRSSQSATALAAATCPTPWCDRHLPATGTGNGSDPFSQMCIGAQRTVTAVVVASDPLDGADGGTTTTTTVTVELERMDFALPTGMVTGDILMRVCADNAVMTLSDALTLAAVIEHTASYALAYVAGDQVEAPDLYAAGLKAGKAEAYAELSSSLTAIVGEYDRAKAEIVGLSGVERAEAILAAGEATARAAASVGVHQPDRLAESAMKALRSGMHR